MSLGESEAMAKSSTTPLVVKTRVGCHRLKSHRPKMRINGLVPDPRGLFEAEEVLQYVADVIGAGRVHITRGLTREYFLFDIAVEKSGDLIHLNAVHVPARDKCQKKTEGLMANNWREDIFVVNPGDLAISASAESGFIASDVAGLVSPNA